MKKLILPLLALLVAAPIATARGWKPKPQPPMPAGIPYVDVKIFGKEHRLYFTVDDHPHPKTPGMLAVLKKWNVTATWFVVTWGVQNYYRHPHYRPTQRLYEYLKKIHKAGHLLGNHSLRHPNMCRVSQERMRYEIMENQRIVKKATGVEMKFWRAPGGLWCQRLYKEVKRAKLKLFRPYPKFSWHVHDYRKSAYWMWWMTKKRVRMGHKYTIILFHYGVSKMDTYLKLLNSQHPAAKWKRGVSK